MCDLVNPKCTDGILWHKSCAVGAGLSRTLLIAIIIEIWLVPEARRNLNPRSRNESIAYKVFLEKRFHAFISPKQSNTGPAYFVRSAPSETQERTALSRNKTIYYIQIVSSKGRSSTNSNFSGLRQCIVGEWRSIFQAMEPKMARSPPGNSE